MSVTSFSAQLINLGWTRSVSRLGWMSADGKRFLSDQEVREYDDILKTPGITNTIPPPPVPVSPSTPTPFSYPEQHRLKVRLNIPPSEKFPWDDVFIVRGNSYVHIMLVWDGGDSAVLLKDDATLYPSDELIGKLRLLQP